MPSVDSTAGDRFVIEGGHPVGGDVTPSGNKNEALPLLAAALLATGSVVIENVPRIRDVTTLIELLRALGVGVDWSGEHAVGVDAGRLRESRPDAALASEIRASFLLAAPLLARTGLAVLPRPGGDRTGRRRAAAGRRGPAARRSRRAPPPRSRGGAPTRACASPPWPPAGWCPGAAASALVAARPGQDREAGP